MVVGVVGSGGCAERSDSVVRGYEKMRCEKRNGRGKGKVEEVAWPGRAPSGPVARAV